MSRVPTLLAYACTAYLLASVFYIGSTACMGTPFKDSLTTKQRAIYQQASEDRGRVFAYGLFGAAVVLLLTQPF